MTKLNRGETYLTDEEMEKIKKRAKKVGTSVSLYLKLKALDKLKD